MARTDASTSGTSSQKASSSQNQQTASNAVLQPSSAQRRMQLDIDVKALAVTRRETRHSDPNWTHQTAGGDRINICNQALVQRTQERASCAIWFLAMAPGQTDRWMNWGPCASLPNYWIADSSTRAANANLSIPRRRSFALGMFDWLRKFAFSIRLSPNTVLSFDNLTNEHDSCKI